MRKNGKCQIAALWSAAVREPTTTTPPPPTPTWRRRSRRKPFWRLSQSSEVISEKKIEMLSWDDIVSNSSFVECSSAGADNNDAASSDANLVKEEQEKTVSTTITIGWSHFWRKKKSFNDPSFAKPPTDNKLPFPTSVHCTALFYKCVHGKNTHWPSFGWDVS